MSREEDIDINPFITEPELIALISQRALQLEKSEKPLVPVPVKVGDGIFSWDPVDIASEEIREKKISLFFKRMTPSGIVTLESKDMILFPN